MENLLLIVRDKQMNSFWQNVQRLIYSKWEMTLRFIEITNYFQDFIFMDNRNRFLISEKICDRFTSLRKKDYTRRIPPNRPTIIFIHSNRPPTDMKI